MVSEAYNTTHNTRVVDLYDPFFIFSWTFIELTRIHFYVNRWFKLNETSVHKNGFMIHDDLQKKNVNNAMKVNGDWGCIMPAICFWV